MLLLIRIAWRNIWRQQRRTWITVGAMAFGVAFSMATIAWSDGVFADMFRVLVRQNMGHVQVHAPLYPKQRALYETIPDGALLLRELAAAPEVSAITGRLYGYALLGVGDEAAGAQLTGMDPRLEPTVTGMDTKILEGHYLSPQPKHEILLGEGLAETLKASVGAELVAVTQAADGSLGNDLFTVTGIFRTGSVIVDRSGAFTHQDDLGELLVLPGELHEIVLLAHNDDGADDLAAAVKTRLADQDLLVRTWKEINPQAAQILQLQDASVAIILLMVFSVAALGVLNTMLMSVFERTKELGVIRALGLKPRQLVALVLWETLALATVSAGAGLVIGLLMDLALVHWGIDLRIFVSSDTWSFSGVSLEPIMYGLIRPGGIVATIAGLYIISVLAALWPAIQAARVQPVVAMRQE